MEKAILVFDMPKSCSACKLKSTVRGIQGVTHCCNLAEEMITLKDGFNKRLNNCPLSSMPENDTKSYFPDEYSDGYKSGWNAALDTIIGDTN